MTTLTASTNVTAKACRLLTTVCVKITSVKPGEFVAIVAGDTGTYLVWRGRRGVWHCTCTAADFGQACAHRLAVALVANRKDTAT